MKEMHALTVVADRSFYREVLVDEEDVINYELDPLSVRTSFIGRVRRTSPISSMMTR